MKWARAVLWGCVVVCCLGGTGRAADSYSNSLTGFSGLSTNPTVQTAVSNAGLSFFSTTGATVLFDGAGAHFGNLNAGDAGRNYMRTVASDFVLSSFVAEITFITQSDEQAVFIGLGSGNTALNGTPDQSTLFSSASFWPESANNKFVRFRTQNDINQFRETGVAGLNPGTHRFRMSYDGTTRMLLGEIDLNYAGGAFVADAMTNNAPINLNPLFLASGWPSEPSRIFFGGDDGATFRDLSIVVQGVSGVPVIPLPAAVWSGLGMLGMMGLSAWRKGRVKG